jgi:hypothetical protein
MARWAEDPTLPSPKLSANMAKLQTWHEVPGPSATPRSRPVGYSLIRAGSFRASLRSVLSPQDEVPTVLPANLGRLGVIHPLQIGEQPWPGRIPAQILPRLLA